MSKILLQSLSRGLRILTTRSYNTHEILNKRDIITDKKYDVIGSIPNVLNRATAARNVSYCKDGLLWNATNIPPQTSNLLRNTNCGSRNSTSQFHTDEERTTATILNRVEGGPLMVDSFSKYGFRLNNGLAVMGSIALFPKSVLSWSITSSELITEESFSLFYMLAPKLDLLILGIGDPGSKFKLELMRFMRDKGVSLEVLPTEKAVATFNFLNNEGRSIAGAFIPPETIKFAADDYADSLRRKKEFFRDTLEETIL